MRRLWLRRTWNELSPSLERRDDEISVDVPARRAGVARRRLHTLAGRLEPEGYRLEVYVPERQRATGTFGVAVFRREAS